jgi:hypothetical protein
MKKTLTYLPVILSSIIIMNQGNVKAQSWKLAGNNLAGNEKLGSLNNFPVVIVTNNKERMRIDTSGITIGLNTGPNKFLQFGTSAAMKFSQNQYIIHHSNSSEGLYYNNTLHRIEYRDAVAVPNMWIEWLSSGRSYFRGNMGIGTETPQSKLHVVGDQTLAGNLKFTTGLQSIQFANPGASSNPMMYMFASGFANPNRMVFAHSPAAANFGLQYNDITDQFDFLGAGTSRLAINLGSGNIGIGTLTPARRLQVQDGDIRISRSASVARYLEFVSTVSNHNDVRMEHDINSSTLWFSSSTDDFSTFNDLANFSLSSSPTFVFTVYGSAFASGGTWTNSDLKIKKDINDFNSAMDIVKQLKPKTYFYKKDEYKNLNLSSAKQYGFIAQDLEKVLPELVQTSQQPVRNKANGEREMVDVKSINYPELIPVLTKAIQEQQKQMDELKKEIEELKQMVQKLSQNGTVSTGTVSEATKTNIVLSNVKLEQNKPNPLKNTTSIQYNIPVGVKNAHIIITDNSGKTIKQITLNTGAGVVNIDASVLSNGTYNYTLLVDGKLIESKKMTVAH